MARGDRLTPRVSLAGRVEDFLQPLLATSRVGPHRKRLVNDAGRQDAENQLEVVKADLDRTVLSQLQYQNALPRQGQDEAVRRFTTPGAPPW